MLLNAFFQLVGLAAVPAAEKYTVPDDVQAQVIRRYLEAAQVQRVTRRNGNVQVTVEARLPRLNKEATLRTLRSTSAAGTITYATLDARGDSMVRREVIARYLAAESDGRTTDQTAITPFNYRFRFIGTFDEPSRRVYVFQLAPKKKQVGLFKGELWVDGRTGLPVHESGQFVKNPSMFLKGISFTRDYTRSREWGVDVHIHSTVESRIAGRVELDIRFVDAI